MHKFLKNKVIIYKLNSFLLKKIKLKIKFKKKSLILKINLKDFNINKIINFLN